VSARARLDRNHPVRAGQQAGRHRRGAAFQGASVALSADLTIFLIAQAYSLNYGARTCREPLAIHVIPSAGRPVDETKLPTSSSIADAVAGLVEAVVVEARTCA
jgi:hypothetical protein